jgi:enterochelin esterase family protein
VDAGSYDVAYRRELDRRSWIEWGDSTRARRFLELPPVPPSGTVTEHTVKSDGFGARHLWVYTPPGYPDSCARGTGCDLVVAFDGGVYVDAIPLPFILDSLTAAGVIRATVALLVDDGSSSTRLADLANHARFGSLVGNTLMPWLHAHYRATTSDPARTIITGSSAGGLAAAFLALERPDLFGNVLSQSGAFWRGSEGSNGPPFEWLTSRYGAEPKRAIRFFLDVGSTESRGAMNGTAPSIRDANRRLNAVLTAKGYTVDYFEVPGGIHAPESWRLRLPAGLARLAAGFAVSGALRPSR